MPEAFHHSKEEQEDLGSLTQTLLKLQNVLGGHRITEPTMNTPLFERPLFFFDQTRFRKDLKAADTRIIPIFKDAINAANVHLDTRFDEGEEISALIYERALFIDCILHYAWHQFSWTDQASLIAVGGYGRGELHPKSDIDLLLLLKEERAEDLESAQNLLMLLWDIGLDIGHSVRTIEQCVDDGDAQQHDASRQSNPVDGYSARLVAQKFVKDGHIFTLQTFVPV